MNEARSHTEQQGVEITALNDEINALADEVFNLGASRDSLNDDIAGVQQEIQDLAAANAGELGALDSDIVAAEGRLAETQEEWANSLQSLRDDLASAHETNYAEVSAEWRDVGGVIDQAVDEHTALLADQIFEVCTEVEKTGDNQYAVHTKTRRE